MSGIPIFLIVFVAQKVSLSLDQLTRCGFSNNALKTADDPIDPMAISIPDATSLLFRWRVKLAPLRQWLLEMFVARALLKDYSVFQRWIAENDDTPVAPVIQEFQQAIEGDENLRSLFKNMFLQIPHEPPFTKDPLQQPQIWDYKVMLKALNKIISKPPEYSDSEFVAFPINAMFDWATGTPAGTAVFYLDSVNDHIRKVLNHWNKFLASPASRSTLTTERGGWFSEEARAAMPDFEEDFVCDPSKPYHGFISWDDFFTRRFRDGRRPLPEPYNQQTVTNACESIVYNCVSGVKAQDLFWLKESAYSLSNMLNSHPFTDQFVGGTVYQAFLSAMLYHRWHAPVAGRVLEVQMIPGTYYSTSPTMSMSASSRNSSQGYLSAVATRAIIYIQADNPDIGLMCFMAIGMAEVSTCDVTVRKGDKLKQGDQLGMFHFGGSTHCLIFRPSTKIKFTEAVKIGDTIRLNEPIAYVVS